MNINKNFNEFTTTSIVKKIHFSFQILQPTIILWRVYQYIKYYTSVCLSFVTLKDAVDWFIWSFAIGIWLTVFFSNCWLCARYSCQRTWVRSAHFIDDVLDNTVCINLVIISNVFFVLILCWHYWLSLLTLSKKKHNADRTMFHENLPLL